MAAMDILVNSLIKAIGYDPNQLRPMAEKYVRDFTAAAREFLRRNEEIHVKLDRLERQGALIDQRAIAIAATLARMDGRTVTLEDDVLLNRSFDPALCIVHDGAKEIKIDDLMKAQTEGGSK